MHPVRRVIVVAVPILAMVGMTVGMAGFTSAALTPTTLSCGAVITTDTLLANDVGPCPGDGLIVNGNNIRLDLGGHSVFGEDPATEPADKTEQVGIHLMNGASNDTVQNGSVYWFDAGVALDPNSNGNTIQHLYVHDNVNDILTTTGSDEPCSYGDGITVDTGSNNVIQANTVVHNGPFSGISLVNASIGNTVAKNIVKGHNIENVTPNGGTAAGCGAPFARPVQDIGIRIEGPGAVNNTAKANFVTDSSLDAISIHGYVGGQPANHDNFILNNDVSLSGQATFADDPDANGIGILRQGPLSVVCIAYHNTISGNYSHDNFRDGIFVGGPRGTSRGCTGNGVNTITKNSVIGNHRDGIHVNNGAVNNTFFANSGARNGQFDAADYNRSCDNNSWRANGFLTVNQPCVANLGGGAVRQVLLLGASGSSGAKTLTTSWTGPATVANPGGFTVYSNSTCATLIGTGQSVVPGTNGTFSPAVVLNSAPAKGVPAWYKIAASSVTSTGVGNAAVPCSPITFGT